MNISDIINNREQPSYAQSAGMVFVIRCTPDIFTREQLNVGVCAIGSNGTRKVKAISEPGRLKCLYGEAASNVVLLAQAAADAALAGAPSPSPQIVFDEPTPYYNSTIDEVVASTFADQVTVALPHRGQNETEHLDDEKALQDVSDAIKLYRGIDMELIANTPQVLINTERGPRTLRVPFQPRNGVGTVRSAHYSPATLKTHLMDSVLDMECAARYRHKKNMGVFILRPSKVTKEVNRQLDDVIDGVAYRAPAAMHLDVAYSAADLAKIVSEWAEASD